MSLDLLESLEDSVGLGTGLGESCISSGNLTSSFTVCLFKCVDSFVAILDG